MDKLYHYRAHVLSVYDGDTATLDFDLGMKMMIKKEMLGQKGVVTSISGKNVFKPNIL